jgi:hypothetical protein
MPGVSTSIRISTFLAGANDGANVFIAIGGTFKPFQAERIKQLYPTHMACWRRPAHQQTISPHNGISFRKMPKRISRLQKPADNQSIAAKV